MDPDNKYPMELTSKKGISIIMPTYNQAHFISRTITSLFLQSFSNWELIIINDGSTDNTEEEVRAFLNDKRILYFNNEENIGLGRCLNVGIGIAKFDLISYLPSDDIFYQDHLLQLFEKICSAEAVLAYSGMKHDFDNSSQEGRVEGMALQPVQVIHIKNEERWIERSELVTDDYDKMFWNKLKTKGQFVSTNKVSCEWTRHPDQRHRIIKEGLHSGIYRYKKFYNVKEPIRFHSKHGNYINEIETYKRFRSESSKTKRDGLKILLVGELAYNPERICAFEERGHKLYGLWMNKPSFFNTTGPMAFGQIEDIPIENWISRVKELDPDIIYCLLNFQAIQFAHQVLLNNPGVPFVWHFKEGPFFSMVEGSWKELLDLYKYSDGQVYTNEETKDWFGQFLQIDESKVHILDGDLPKKDWFVDSKSQLLSEIDGEIHTLVAGRPMGLPPEAVEMLAEYKIHLHIYGKQGFWKDWAKRANERCPEYLHFHQSCSQENWVREFSKYDAGWLHFFESENYGEKMRCTWDDLNYPNRLGTYASAGLPLLMRNNKDHIVATQTLAEKLDIGIFINNAGELNEIIRNKQRMSLLRKNAWENRHFFTFDHHVDSLINFFEKIIGSKRSVTRKIASPTALLTRS